MEVYKSVHLYMSSLASTLIAMLLPVRIGPLAWVHCEVQAPALDHVNS